MMKTVSPTTVNRVSRSRAWLESGLAARGATMSCAMIELQPRK